MLPLRNSFICRTDEISGQWNKYEMSNVIYADFLSDFLPIKHKKSQQIYIFLKHYIIIQMVL